jgi:hypothetical protein
VVRCVAVLGLAVLAVTGVVEPAYPQGRGVLPPFERVVEQFSEVAFGNEHGISREIIQKWSVPPSIGYFVQPQFDVQPHIKRISRLIADIDGLTGLSLTSGTTENIVTLRFGFYPRADFRKLPIRNDSEGTRRFFAESACVALAISNPNRPGDITTGAVVIGTDMSDSLRRHCILEELVQVLGLPNDACKYRPSLFCEEDIVYEMTPADRILLATLYDDRIVVGMSRVDAMPLVRTVISELYAHATE